MVTNVIPLGTAAALPTASRHLSALALERKGRVLLFDCGEGTQYRLLDAGLARVRVDAIFITHLHGDHCYGLPGLLSTLGLQQRRAPVTLVLPPGGRSMLTATPGGDPEGFPFPLRVREMGVDLSHTVVYETDEATVAARPLLHRGFAMGFRFEERERPGRFDPERARALGVPEGPAFGRLQEGTPVTTADGTTVEREQVLGPGAASPRHLGGVRDRHAPLRRRPRPRRRRRPALPRCHLCGRSPGAGRYDRSLYGAASRHCGAGRRCQAPPPGAPERTIRRSGADEAAGTLGVSGGGGG
jgi:hypothetical protein